MRKSGVLMHITSLPGPYGVGTMGANAYAFADFLRKAGQSCWQILPLNPTGYGDSPYQSCSAFASNHYLIDLDLLVEQGLLKPELSFIAEDLGYLTPEVLQLRDDSGWPGMKVLEFAFDSREPSLCLPHTYIQNTVCYTGTHDNMTLRQWLESAPRDTLEYAAEYMALNAQENYVWGVIRTAMGSVSDLCMVQLQDLLELGGEARMNFPGTADGTNWTWRAETGSYDDALAEKLRNMTRLYGRLAENQ